MSQQYPFSTEPLPYDYRALEPEIDAETLHFHHDKHLQAYVDNLNKALADYPAYHSWSLEKLLKQGDARQKRFGLPYETTQAACTIISCISAVWGRKKTPTLPGNWQKRSTAILAPMTPGKKR